MSDPVPTGSVKGQVPEPKHGLVVFDQEFPDDRWRIEGVAADDRVEATRIVPADGIRHSWSRDTWQYAWQRGWLILAGSPLVSGEPGQAKGSE